MKTAQELRETATSKQRHLVEHMKRGTHLASRLDLNNLNHRDMESLRSTLELAHQNFHEFAAFANALLTGDAPLAHLRNRRMRVNVLKRCEIEIKYVRIEVPVRYDEEDIPNDFPLRVGDMWRGTVEVDTGRIIEWPQGKSGDMHMKVTDNGTYILQDEDKNIIAIKQDYVPHGCVPGKYGDYIQLSINEQGVVTNWPKSPSFNCWGLDEE